MNIFKCFFRLILLTLIFIAYSLPYIIGNIILKNGGNEILVQIIALSFSLLIIFFIWKIYHSELKITIKDNIVSKYYWLPVALFIVSIILESFIDVPTSNNQNAIVESFEKFPIFTAINGILIAPIGEEFIFRGLFAKYFFPNQNTNLKIILYLLFSSSLFSLVHGPDTFLIFILYFSSGLFLGLAFVGKKDLKYPIVLHMINNSLAFLLI